MLASSFQKKLKYILSNNPIYNFMNTIVNMSQFPQYTVSDANTMLNLGVGQPSPDFLKIPMSMMRLRMSSMCTYNPDVELLQYGNKQGFPWFRDAVADMLSMFGEEQIDPEHIYMTNGVSQAVLMLASFFKPYTKYVFVEDPTYFIMLKTFKDLGYDGRVVDLNNLESFDDTLGTIFEENPDQNVAVYIVPFHQNPTGKSITEIQVDKLVQLCDKYVNLKILSDETYQMLSFNDKEMTSLSIKHKNIISIGTFSKILAPAFRVGWLHSKNTELFKMLDSSGYMDSGGGVNPVMGYIVSGIISKTEYINHVYELRHKLNNNCNALRSALMKYPDHFEASSPDGGYFLWVKSKKLNATQLLNIAKMHKVSFHVGTKFSINEKFDDCFRLSFSYYSHEDLKLFENRLDSIVDDIDNLLDRVPHIVAHIIGANGKLGKLIVDECKKEGIHTVVILRGCTLNVNPFNKNIFVDVSSVRGTIELIETLMKNSMKYPLIIGTTGDLPTELIDAYSKTAKVKVSSNFSIGVNTVNSMLESVSDDYWSAKIIDVHHAQKKDAPSGTAKKFKNILSDKISDEIDICSQRIGTIVGKHEIVLDSEYETISIVHNAKDRRVFAKGCVELIKQMAQ